MNVVDSSGWLEYFADGPNANFFAPAIEALSKLIVPSLTLLEVFKRIASQRGETPAIAAVAQMRQGQVVDLDASLALSAARISLDLKLPLADSVILATARLYDAVVWTQDADFKGLARVQYVARKPRA
ncbi:MAG TPA: type II toxin-antitoxin system VapC family toxin [Terriglobia bacterium]|nr:type II toxin-antitoxin system VapC family toxin [Terriglobia bacterium]